MNEFESLEIDPKKFYIAFKSTTNVFDIRFSRNYLTIWINMKYGTLEDPKQITRDVSQLGHKGNGDYELKIRPGDDINYLIYLIGQSYKVNSS